MRNTRENVVKLLQKCADLAWEQSKNVEYDDSVRAFERHKALAYKEAIWLLTDNKYFNDIYGIFGDETK